MKKILLTALSCFFIFHAQLCFPESDIGKSINDKLDQAMTDLEKNNNTPKAWELLVEVADIIKQHPNYDDGEYAEGIINVVTEILTKPWQYTSPYLTEKKGNAYFRDFLVGHINDLSPQADLKIIKKNISKNCNLSKYKTCEKMINKINQFL